MTFPNEKGLSWITKALLKGGGGGIRNKAAAHNPEITLTYPDGALYHSCLY